MNVDGVMSWLCMMGNRNHLLFLFIFICLGGHVGHGLVFVYLHVKSWFCSLCSCSIGLYGTFACIYIDYLWYCRVRRKNVIFYVSYY